MNKLREDWLTKIEEVRIEKMLSKADMMEDMGINYITYHKLLDPSFPPVSLRTMRRVRDYMDAEQEGE